MLHYATTWLPLLSFALIAAAVFAFFHQWWDGVLATPSRRASGGATWSSQACGRCAPRVSIARAARARSRLPSPNAVGLIVR